MLSIIMDENVALFKLFLLSSCYMSGTEVVNVSFHIVLSILGTQ